MEALLRFIDWVLLLPEELDERFWGEVQAIEEVEKVPYMTGLERRALAKGREEGRREGLLEAIALGLELRFGKEALGDMDAISALEDLSDLERVRDGVRDSAALADLRRSYPGRR